MGIARQIALQVPQIRTLWDQRIQALQEVEHLRQEVAMLKSELGQVQDEARKEASEQWKLSPFAHYNASFDPIAIMHRYEDKARTASPDHLTNFLGIRIDPDLFGGILPNKKGVVEPVPIPANWHADIAEWGSALLAVDEAQGTFRMIELGCGWGCWLNNLGAAARSRGLQLHLIGIEGDAQHVESAYSILRLNGFAETEFQVTHGIAAPYEGKALFPKPENSGAHWGLEPVFQPSEEQVAEAARTGSHHILDATPLSRLSDGQTVDLLHIDIQGGEVDFVKSNYDDIARFVRRVLIGTHSRAIEGELVAFFTARGWAMEMDRPAIVSLAGGVPVIQVDGVHLYRNPAL